MFCQFPDTNYKRKRKKTVIKIVIVAIHQLINSASLPQMMSENYLRNMQLRIRINMLINYIYNTFLTIQITFIFFFNVYITLLIRLISFILYFYIYFHTVDCLFFPLKHFLIFRNLPFEKSMC